MYLSQERILHISIFKLNMSLDTIKRTVSSIYLTAITLHAHITLFLQFCVFLKRTSLGYFNGWVSLAPRLFLPPGWS